MISECIKDNRRLELIDLSLITKAIVHLQSGDSVPLRWNHFIK